MTKNLPNNSTPNPETKMDNKIRDNSLEQQGRALLRQSAKQIRRSETSKFRRISAGSMAMAVAAMQVIPAFATINNTVTVSGAGPLGPVSTTATATVDVANSAPAIKVIETAIFAVPADDANGNGLADAGDKITYVYTVTNTGNVTLKDVIPTQTNDRAGLAPVMVVPTAVTTDSGTVAADTIGDSIDTITTDNKWGILGPGDVITFKSTYSVVTADLTAAGGGTGTGLSGNPEADGFLDDRILVTGSYVNGTASTPVTSTARANTKLDIISGLQVTKTPNVSLNVPAGTVVTYTYTVKNNGNVPITGITMSDTHNGVVGGLVPAFQSFTTNTGSTNTGNTITKLMPGDVAKFTALYTVSQFDVDTRQ
jgi:hypothetical protein